MRIPTSFFRFVVSGGIATCIDLVCYMLLIQIIWVPVSKALSMLVANTWSYTVNRIWVFSSDQQTTYKNIGIYALIQLLNLSTNVGVNSMMLYLTNHLILSFIIATCCATVVNYSLQKKYVFK